MGTLRPTARDFALGLKSTWGADIFDPQSRAAHRTVRSREAATADVAIATTFGPPA